MNLPPSNYVCHRCKIPGHWLVQCKKPKSIMHFTKSKVPVNGLSNSDFSQNSSRLPDDHVFTVQPVQQDKTNAPVKYHSFKRQPVKQALSTSSDKSTKSTLPIFFQKSHANYTRAEILRNGVRDESSNRKLGTRKEQFTTNRSAVQSLSNNINTFSNKYSRASGENHNQSKQQNMTSPTPKPSPKILSQPFEGKTFVPKIIDFSKNESRKIREQSSSSLRCETGFKRSPEIAVEYNYLNISSDVSFDYIPSKRPRLDDAYDVELLIDPIQVNKKPQTKSCASDYTSISQIVFDHETKITKSQVPAIIPAIIPVSVLLKNHESKIMGTLAKVCNNLHASEDEVDYSDNDSILDISLPKSNQHYECTEDLQLEYFLNEQSQINEESNSVLVDDPPFSKDEFKMDESFYIHSKEKCGELGVAINEKSHNNWLANQNCSDTIPTSNNESAMSVNTKQIKRLSNKEKPDAWSPTFNHTIVANSTTLSLSTKNLKLLPKDILFTLSDDIEITGIMSAMLLPLIRTHGLGHCCIFKIPCCNSGSIDPLLQLIQKYNLVCIIQLLFDNMKSFYCTFMDENAGLSYELHFRITNNFLFGYFCDQKSIDAFILNSRIELIKDRKIWIVCKNGSNYDFQVDNCLDIDYFIPTRKIASADLLGCLEPLFIIIGSKSNWKATNHSIIIDPATLNLDDILETLHSLFYAELDQWVKQYDSYLGIQDFIGSHPAPTIEGTLKPILELINN